jgi:hypothetical protein
MEQQADTGDCLPIIRLCAFQRVLGNPDAFSGLLVGSEKASIWVFR